MDFLNLNFIYHPLYQLCFFILITVVFIPFFRKRDSNAIWNVAGLCYIGFIVTNSLFIWPKVDVWNYFFTSLGYSLLYILAAGVFVSFLISALKIKGSEESAMIFIFFIYHPILLLLVIFVKWMFGSLINM